MYSQERIKFDTSDRSICKQDTLGFWILIVILGLSLNCRSLTYLDPVQNSLYWYQLNERSSQVTIVVKWQFFQENGSDSLNQSVLGIILNGLRCVNAPSKRELRSVFITANLLLSSGNLRPHYASLWKKDSVSAKIDRSISN